MPFYFRTSNKHRRNGRSEGEGARMEAKRMTKQVKTYLGELRRESHKRRSYSKRQDKAEMAKVKGEHG